MSKLDRPVPRWLTALSWLILAMTVLVFGFGVYFFPLTAFPESTADAEFPARFMAIRHMAFALPLLRGILTQNVTILRTMYLIFWVMALLDVITIAAYGYYIPFLGASSTSPAATTLIAFTLFLIPMSIAAAWFLRNRNTSTAS